MLTTHLMPRVEPLLTLKSRFDNWEILAHKLPEGWVASAIELREDDPDGMTMGISVGRPKDSWFEAVNEIMTHITPMCFNNIIEAISELDPRFKQPERTIDLNDVVADLKGPGWTPEKDVRTVQDNAAILERFLLDAIATLRRIVGSDKLRENIKVGGLVEGYEYALRVLQSNEPETVLRYVPGFDL